MENIHSTLVRMLDFFIASGMALFTGVWLLGEQAFASQRTSFGRQRIQGLYGRSFWLTHTSQLQVPWHGFSAFQPSSFFVWWAVLRGQMSLTGPWPEAAMARGLKKLEEKPGCFNRDMVHRHLRLPEGVGNGAEQKRTVVSTLAILFRIAFSRCLSGKSNHSSDYLSLAGLDIRNANSRKVITEIKQRLNDGRRSKLFFVNPHCINQALEIPSYARALTHADLLPDGIGIHLAAKWSRQSLVENLNGTDLFPKLCGLFHREGKRVFLLGARKEVVSRVAGKMASEFPGIDICGFHHGHFSDEQESAVVDYIRQCEPDVLLVAMGVPRQELWIDRTFQDLNLSLAVALGGCFDFYAGEQKRAPLWVREMGCEWLFRLIHEPRRLWRRYLVGNLQFLWHLVKKSSVRQHSNSQLEVTHGKNS